MAETIRTSPQLYEYRNESSSSDSSTFVETRNADVPSVPQVKTNPSFVSSAIWPVQKNRITTPLLPVNVKEIVRRVLRHRSRC